MGGRIAPEQVADLRQIHWPPSPGLRIVVTEYGIADLRGKSDRDTIAEMLCVADSAFQRQLRVHAQRAGKLEPDFALPSHAAHNNNKRIEAALAAGRK
jgi:acyl-CoA hydrolase